ncbi:MAG TPA: hypothetical protein VE756_10540 [Burkholderiales bacterium]|nr:hypothetical protein [Burkholderiales bacterium]
MVHSSASWQSCLPSAKNKAYGAASWRRDTIFTEGAACRRRGAGLPCAKGGIKTGTNGVAVYYPFALVALKEFVQSDDYEETGELLLIFEDSDGVQVTLKMRESAIADLLHRLASPPAPHS